MSIVLLILFSFYFNNITFANETKEGFFGIRSVRDVPTWNGDQQKHRLNTMKYIVYSMYNMDKLPDELSAMRESMRTAEGRASMEAMIDNLPDKFRQGLYVKYNLMLGSNDLYFLPIVFDPVTDKEIRDDIRKILKDIAGVIIMDYTCLDTLCSFQKTAILDEINSMIEHVDNDILSPYFIVVMRIFTKNMIRMLGVRINQQLSSFNDRLDVNYTRIKTRDQELKNKLEEIKANELKMSFTQKAIRKIKSVGNTIKNEAKAYIGMQVDVPLSPEQIYSYVFSNRYNVSVANIQFSDLPLHKNLYLVFLNEAIKMLSDISELVEFIIFNNIFDEVVDNEEDADLDDNLKEALLRGLQRERGIQISEIIDKIREHWITNKDFSVLLKMDELGEYLFKLYKPYIDAVDVDSDFLFVNDFVVPRATFLYAKVLSKKLFSINKYYVDYARFLPDPYVVNFLDNPLVINMAASDLNIKLPKRKEKSLVLASIYDIKSLVNMYIAKLNSIKSGINDEDYVEFNTHQIGNNIILPPYNHILQYNPEPKAIQKRFEGKQSNYEDRLLKFLDSNLSQYVYHLFITDILPSIRVISDSSTTKIEKINQLNSLIVRLRRAYYAEATASGANIIANAIQYLYTIVENETIDILENITANETNNVNFAYINLINNEYMDIRYAFYNAITRITTIFDETESNFILNPIKRAMIFLPFIQDIANILNNNGYQNFHIENFNELIRFADLNLVQNYMLQQNFIINNNTNLTTVNTNNTINRSRVVADMRVELNNIELQAFNLFRNEATEFLQVIRNNLDLLQNGTNNRELILLLQNIDNINFTTLEQGNIFALNNEYITTLAINNNQNNQNWQENNIQLNNNQTVDFQNLHNGIFVENHHNLFERFNNRTRINTLVNTNDTIPVIQTQQNTALIPFTRADNDFNDFAIIEDYNLDNNPITERNLAIEYDGEIDNFVDNTRISNDVTINIQYENNHQDNNVDIEAINTFVNNFINANIENITNSAIEERAYNIANNIFIPSILSNNVPYSYSVDDTNKALETNFNKSKKPFDLNNNLFNGDTDTNNNLKNDNHEKELKDESNHNSNTMNVENNVENNIENNINNNIQNNNLQQPINNLDLAARVGIVAAVGFGAYELYHNNDINLTKTDDNSEQNKDNSAEGIHKSNLNDIKNNDITDNQQPKTEFIEKNKDDDYVSRVLEKMISDIKSNIKDKKDKDKSSYVISNFNFNLPDNINKNNLENNDTSHEIFQNLRSRSYNNLYYNNENNSYLSHTVENTYNTKNNKNVNIPEAKYIIYRYSREKQKKSINFLMNENYSSMKIAYKNFNDSIFDKNVNINTIEFDSNYSDNISVSFSHNEARFAFQSAQIAIGDSFDLINIIDTIRKRPQNKKSTYIYEENINTKRYKNALKNTETITILNNNKQYSTDATVVLSNDIYNNINNTSSKSGKFKLSTYASYDYYHTNRKNFNGCMLNVSIAYDYRISSGLVFDISLNNNFYINNLKNLMEINPRISIKNEFPLMPTVYFGYSVFNNNYIGDYKEKLYKNSAECGIIIGGYIMNRIGLGVDISANTNKIINMSSGISFYF